MTKLLIGLLGAGVIATGGYAAATSVDADPASTVSLPAATSSSGTTTADTAEDAPRPLRPGARHDDGRRRGHLRPVRRGRACERPALHGRSPCRRRRRRPQRRRRRRRRRRSGHSAAGDDDRSGSNSGKG